MAKQEVARVKIGERHVAAKSKLGGYSANTTYEIPRPEAKAIVDAKLGSYAQKGARVAEKVESATAQPTGSPAADIQSSGKPVPATKKEAK